LTFYSEFETLNYNKKKRVLVVFRKKVLRREGNPFIGF
jgi:hypothetical protein